MEKIDILINSCARPDIMDVSLKTFRERVKTTYPLRYVLLEDCVNDHKRQALGREWIDSQELDEVVYAEKKMGPGKFFAPVVALCKSDFFFHLEDDNKFVADVYLDPIIEFMKNNDEVVEVILSRGNHPSKVLGKELMLDLVPLTELKLFSVATGVFNTTMVKKIIDSLGWNIKLHEAALLTPAANTLGLKRFLLGHKEQHYIHVGEVENYRKGAWK